jgi:two-component system, NtrC family, sensor kinase
MRGLRFHILVVLLALQFLTVSVVSFGVLKLVQRHMEEQARMATENIAEIAALTMAAALDPERDLTEPANLFDLARIAEIFCSNYGGMQAHVLDGRLDPLVSWPTYNESAWSHGSDARVAMLGSQSLSEVANAADGVRQVEAFSPLILDDVVVGVVVILRPLGEVQRTMNLTQQLLVWYLCLSSVVTLIVGFFLLSRTVIRPLEVLGRATERVADGDLAGHVDEVGPGEMGRLARSFNRMMDRIRAGRDQLQQRVRELADSNARLESAQQEVVRSERLATVGQLAAGVAHEVGNPLSAIMGLVELLNDDLDIEDRHDTVRRIQAELARIDRTIRELLDYARMRSNPSARVRISQPIETAIRLLSHHSRGKQVKVAQSLPDPAPVLGVHEDQMVQVLLNLLLNAADAMQGQGVVEVSVTAPDEGWVEVRIQDHGPGIPEHLLPRIFDPFFTTKSPGVGTGLGLAICERVVAGYGGRLTVESTADGVTVTVRLPAAVSAESDAIVRHV